MKENLIKKDSKKIKILIIIGIITTLIILIGSAYAFFSYSRSVEALTLTSNSISATFANGSNSISLQNAYPLSNEYALSHLSDLGYIDFTVSGSAENPDEAVSFEVFLTEKSGNTLANNFIKVYVTDNQGKVVLKPTLYNSLSNTSYTSEPTGKIVVSKTLAGTFSKSYRLYAWIDSSYSENVSKTFSFYVNLYAYNNSSDNVERTGTEKLIRKLGTDGLIAINTDGGLYDGTGTIREYRYSGVDSRWSNAEGTVKNYITFNNEMWRIVGIFKGDTDDGANAWNIKIVRDYPIGSLSGVADSIQVPSSYASTGAGTKTLADGTYSISASGSYPAFVAQKVYWNNGGTNSGYAYPSKSGILLWLNEYENTGSWYYQNYTSPGSNSAYKDFIAETTFYTRAGNYSTTVANEYNLERTTGTIRNSEPTYTGKIGMLYVSDYAYASAPTIWNGTSTTISSYSNTGGLSSNKLNNWMLKPNDSSGFYWFISPSSHSSVGALRWDCTGRVSGITVNDYSNGLRPVLNLKSDTLLEVGGEGTYDNPYTIIGT